MGIVVLALIGVYVAVSIASSAVIYWRWRSENKSLEQNGEEKT